MLESFDERVLLGVEQMQAKVAELEQFISDVSAGVLPDPDAIAKARHDIANMTVGLPALHKLIARTQRAEP